MKENTSRITLLMDQGWLFHKGEIEALPVEARSVYAYHCMSKSNRGRGAAAPSWEDRNWEKVNLPHDYAILGRIDPRCPSAHGSLPRENAWYRMHFQLDESMANRRCILEFDGVATSCEVWVNGHLIKRHRGAYLGFEADFTDVAVYGDQLNTVTVHVDASEFEGWWYEGAGIYRHVRLVLKRAQHIRRWGVLARPSQQADGSWQVYSEIELENFDYAPANVRLRQEIMDSQGRSIALAETMAAIAPRNHGVFAQRIEAGHPALWSPEDPQIYVLRTTVYQGEEELDRWDTEFGFRKVEFSSHGMLVNGKATKIHGACVHEDYGALGTAVPDVLKEFRLRKLMEMGVNGVRCAHNVQSEEQFSACDRLGLMVMAENRWFESYGDGLEQLKEMIRRDRNHPSIFFWSMGNEEPCQRLASGGRIMRAMREAVRQLDDTRPCLLGMHTGLMDDGAALYCDVIGMNYNEDKFERVHHRFPERAIVGSEMYSTSLDPEGDRGLGLYTCEMLDKLPYLVGIYIWTGIDYRGEHIYPTVISNAGAMDLNCQPRDDFYLYQSMWTRDPMVRIHTHWNHEPGEMVEVYTYSNMERVELYLNDRLLGVQTVKPYRPQVWKVPFEAGVLRAVGMSGDERTTHLVRTAGEADHVALESVLSEDSGLILVNARVVDAQGVPCMNDRSCIDIELRGGRLAGACNGDIFDQTGALETHRPVYQGLCQLVIHPVAADVEVRVTLKDRTEVLSIHCPPISNLPSVASLDNPCVTGWVQSQVYEQKPSLESLEPSAWKNVESDINCSWNFFDDRNIDSGMSSVNAWVCEYASTTVPDGGKKIHFGEFCKGTQICISRPNRPRGEFVVEVTRDGEHAVFDASCLKAGEKLEIFILLYAKHASDGLNGPVYWQ